MRFVLATVALVIAIGLAGFGVAQRTILNGANNVTAEVQTTSDAAVTVIGGTTLNSLDGRQNVAVSGSDTIFAAYARTSDVLAWIGDTTYNEIGFDAQTLELTSTTRVGAETAVPSPAGSDLWLREYTGENRLETPVVLDKDLSIIVVSDGTAAAPSNISIRWPVDNRTPWAGPLIALGGLMLMVSLVFFIWGLVHARRSRGPRRSSIAGPKNPRGPRMPKLPRQRSYRVRKPRAVTFSRGRRSTRRMVAVVPALLIGAVTLSGCSSNLWPEFGDASASPDPSAPESSAQVVDTVPPPVATARQITSIVDEVTKLAAETDASLDAAALAARFAGPALELRTGNYALRAKDSAELPPPAIATAETGEVVVTLPQQLSLEGEQWPRSVFAIVKNTVDETKAPIALVLIQQSPRDQYKVNYAVELQPGVKIPDLAPKGVGATSYGLDTKLLSLPPEALLAAYIDVINGGTASASFPLFDVTNDKLLADIGLEKRTARKAALPATLSLEYTNAPGTGRVVALSSDETGALVTVSLAETEVVKPVEAGATLNPEGEVKTLSGITGTTKGTTASYTTEMLFYIPPITSTEKVTLLGFSAGLVSAKELP